MFFGIFFPVGYFSQKTITRIASDLAFVEGAVIFFAGALIAFYRLSISSPVKILMTIGAAMIGLSVVFGMLT
jgi:CHASE2 domain-containing sensor protein